MLHFSIRILPHKQNTGGFFVAVLEKKYSLRDVQNASKLCTTVHDPVMDGSMDGSTDVTIQSAATENSNTSPVLDIICPSESIGGVASADGRVSKTAASRSSIAPGWFIILKPS